jgi:hypothetical protein
MSAKTRGKGKGKATVRKSRQALRQSTFNTAGPAKQLDDVQNKISDAPTHAHAESSTRQSVGLSPGYYMDKDTKADTKQAYRQTAARVVPQLPNSVAPPKKPRKK